MGLQGRGCGIKGPAWFRQAAAPPLPNLWTNKGTRVNVLVWALVTAWGRRLEIIRVSNNSRENLTWGQIAQHLPGKY